MAIKNLFSEKRKVMSQKSISDITGSATPVESSDYIDNYLIKKERFLPPINFATASNFAKFGSAKQYSADAVQRIHNTYPYDGSLSEKITWLNSSNFYDLYIFNHRYPRTCGYAVFSPLGWGARVGSEVNGFGYSDSLEYIQLKGGPHPDPSSGSLKLSRQFPAPYNGRANLYDATTGVSRESNLALDLDKGVTVEYWIKGPSSAAVVSELAGKTTGQVSFDLWNGYTGTSEGDSYGRFMLYSAAGAIRALWASGSLVKQHTIDSDVAAALSDGNWHHIAVTAKQIQDGSDFKIEWNDFLDGHWLSKDLSTTLTGGRVGAVTGSLIANVGAARLPTSTQAQSAHASITTMISNGINDGFGKLSGSIDEFRYWKTARTPQQIKRFWNTQIGGGSNTDSSKFSGSAQPVDLGVYYKFNEGNVGNVTTDATALDYSGRISNGTWTGYMTGSSRITGETASAIIESSASVNEFKDPIIYSSHPDVLALTTLLTEEGEEWDLQNNMALYHTMPEWITSEDQDEGGEQLKKLTQIIASYLDTTYLQIQALPSITKNQYPYEELILHDPNENLEQQTDVLKFSNSPVPFARNLIEDLGMGASEIFSMADELATLGNRDEQEEFEQKLYDIKNTIYQNIYNNLTYIYKSKGTEKSFRNLIRCYGVDDELIKINLYVDGATYSFSDSDYRSTAVKDKYINFNDPDRIRSTIYQSASYSTSNSISYIPGWNPSNALTAGATGSAMTFEADVIFPRKFKRTDLGDLWYEYPHLTSSIFGCHTAQPTVSTPEDFAWVTEDSASFQVYALRDVEESQDVRFMLTSSNGSIPTLTSDLFQEVYDNERWLFAVKVYPESPLEGRWVSAGGSATVSGSWTIELQGYNPLLDQMQNSFSVSASIPAKDGTYFMNANKRLYAGAHRINFSGSLDKHTDVKIGSVRVWDDYLSDFEVAAHAKDPTNFGREHSYKNSYLFNQDTTPSTDIDSIPQFETLLLNWTFENVTGSTAGAYLQDHYGGSAWDGSFEVLDHSSGSDDKWEVNDRYKHHYTGRGDWFLSEDTTSLVDTNYLSVVKTNLPEVSSGEDMISILDTDDNYFTRDSKPINHYFAIEKSMYQTISEEMLNIFATTMEFNNLIGEPVNRYRQEYKSLGKLREAFFRKIGNAPDFNKYVNFYKWIDGSLTDMLMQLVPMSANFSDGIKTMVESHILERNKYWNKFPTLEMKAEPIVGRLKGINELSYDWEHGHAPLNPTPYSNEGTNCLWWQQRSEASASFTAGNQVDTDRNVLRRILTSDVTTNKILATGEYTDPTNYPNSGFPNAAEFNLAQDGANLASRTQYKGSTYALRSFSKPYKIEAEETVQIHGGINYHANKRRELTKHWAVLASPMGAYISLAPGYTDDLLDCDDVINPSKKEFHSFAIDPGGGFGSGPVPEKGAHFAPFNFVSSSVTTNSSLAETGIDIVNLHDDSYGGTNERPMQGPFTERHVGGMAHRHQDVSDTTHTSVTRTENFKVSGIKDVGFFVIPGDYASPGTKHSDQPFDRFYRDGVAKRPVNIRNILTTTDSALSQSALGNYESEIQILNTHNEGGTFLAKMQAATGSDGFYTINSPNMSLVISDTADTPKLLAVGKTLLDSSTALLPPYSTSQFNPYLSKNKITERFSAPGDPSTAGDAFGGFGIDKTANKYSVYNALPWRNRQVRFPTNALLTAHTGKYGSFSGSALGATDITTAATASFHKTHRNTDYTFKHTDALTAFRAYSVYFGAADNPRFFKNSVTSVDSLTRMSISVWFKLDAVSGQQTLISLTDNVILLTSSDTIQFRVYDGAADWTYFNVADCLQADTWHHLVLAFDQGNTQEWRTSTLDYATMDSTNKFYPKMWLDGKPQTVTVSQTTTWTGTTEVLNAINVGTRADGNSAWDLDGYIQDISLWNTVLSDDQVSEIYRLPGYDSFGPGDLTRLDYVNTDADSNQLHAWWLFNNSSTVSDVAPIGNALDLAAKGGTTPVVNAAHFLPANYYGTECAQRFDNYYVQHPIPANDFGYAWITASADHSEGCELLTTASFITASIMGSARLPAQPDEKEIFYGLSEDVPTSQEFIPVDFAGLNTNIYEPVSSSSNILGYPNFVVGFPHPAGSVYDQELTTYTGGIITNISAGVQKAQILNGLLLHRNGPYGHPSWKQIRGGNHPIIREHKKSNTHSMLLTNGVIQGSRLSRIVTDKTGAQPNADELGAKHHEVRRISNLVETPVSTNHPLVHRVETVMDGIAQELTIRHTYANNLVTFANPIRRKMVDRLSPKEQPRQTYDDFKDIYLSDDEDPSVNPVSGFKSLIYKQTIYPKLENTYISGSRRRLVYAETAAHISQSKNGEYRTFWKDNLEDRRREDGALNSMGYPIYANPNIVTAAGVGINVEKLVLGRGTLSSWPLDTGAGAADASFEFLKTLDPHVAAIRGCYSVTKSADMVPVTEGDQFGGVWGELQRNTLGTLFGSLNTAKLASLNGLNTRGDASNYHHFLNDTHIKTHGTASQFLDHYTLAGSVFSGAGLVPDWEWIHVYPITLTNTDKYHWVAGSSPQQYSSGSRGLAPSNWTTHHRSGRNPWFNSYEDYADDINSMGKEYTVLPEFKISEHIDHYINSGGFKSPRKNYKFLSLPGAPHSASADTYFSDYNSQFWKEYTHSDFMKDFEMIQSDHEDFADISVIDLKCSAIKKLLPYNGFYPAQRCLQLGALMSSSYSQYLGGSSEADYGPENPYDSRSKYRAERLQSLLQPFYAPGIMYNSIKSGVAVDYPIHTSQAAVSPYVGVVNTQYSGSGAVYPSGHVNSCSASLSTIISSPDMRMPFEALIDPDTYLSSLDSDGNPTRMYLTAPYYGSSSFYATFLGSSKPQYKMAMNNFAAEVPNFFLKEKTLTTFTSAPQSKFKNFVSGTTYYMDIVLEKTPDLIMNSHFLGEDTLELFEQLMDNPDSTYKGTTQLVGWGYGPQYWITSSLQANGQITWGDSGGNYRANHYDPAFAVHSPPYLYGAATARISFKPHEAVEMAEGEALSFPLDSILAQSQRQGIEYIKEYGVGQPGALSASLECLGHNLEDSIRYPGKDHQMQVSSSVNLFGTTHIPLIDYDASSGNPITATAAQTEANKAWVLHTKWETPVLNFANGTGGGLGPNETDEDMLVTGSWWELDEIPFALQRPLGIWKGYGSVPTGNSGIHLKIKESFPEKIANRSAESSLTGSLIESCGFQAQQKKVGELAESKWISEAVVAIPFVDVEGERKFFALGNTLAQSRDIFLRAVAGEEGPGRSIKQLANKMPRYVLPPHLDFLNDDGIEPFAMYIFEFSHKLSQQDLSNIWQNVMPEIAVTAEKSTSALSHTTGENEFFRGNKLPDNTRWMVFKVKQRAAMNYFKMTADSKDDHNFKFDFNANAELDYNYNWPYDYFSLVELAKLDVKIGLGDDAFPIPPVFTPIMGSTIANMAALTPVSPMVANPDNLNLGSLGTTLPALTFQSDTGTQAAYDVSKQKAAFQLGKAASMGATGLLSTMKKLTGGGNN